MMSVKHLCGVSLIYTRTVRYYLIVMNGLYLALSSNPSLTRAQYTDTRETTWKIAALYMIVDKGDDVEQYQSLDDLDISKAIKIMTSCRLFVPDGSLELYDKVRSWRNKWMHSPDNQMDDNNITELILNSKQLLGYLGISSTGYYTTAIQELQKYEDYDIYIGFGSLEVKDWLTKVSSAKEIAAKLHKAIRNKERKREIKQLQDLLEEICRTSMQPIVYEPKEYKAVVVEFMGKQIEAIDSDMNECDKQSEMYDELQQIRRSIEKRRQELSCEIEKEEGKAQLEENAKDIEDVNEKLEPEELSSQSENGEGLTHQELSEEITWSDGLSDNEQNVSEKLEMKARTLLSLKTRPTLLREESMPCNVKESTEEERHPRKDLYIAEKEVISLSSRHCDVKENIEEAPNAGKDLNTTEKEVKCARGMMCRTSTTKKKKQRKGRFRKKHMQQNSGQTQYNKDRGIKSSTKEMRHELKGADNVHTSNPGGCSEEINNKNSEKESCVAMHNTSSRKFEQETSEERRSHKNDHELACERYEYFSHDDIYSQWYPSEFLINNMKFSCALQFMAYRKAVLFNDYRTSNEIRRCIDPGRIRDLGKKIKGFDQNKWELKCLFIAYEGNKEKFIQNEKLLKELILTHPKLLVEASPSSKMWGIGLEEDSPLALDESTWKGKNYLGYVLTDVRDDIIKERGLFCGKDIVKENKRYIGKLMKDAAEFSKQQTEVGTAIDIYRRRQHDDSDESDSDQNPLNTFY